MTPRWSTIQGKTPITVVLIEHILHLTIKIKKTQIQVGATCRESGYGGGSGDVEYDQNVLYEIIKEVINIFNDQNKIKCALVGHLLKLGNKKSK